MPERELTPRPGAELKALQWTGDNTAEVREWMGFLGHATQLLEGNLLVTQDFRGMTNGLVEAFAPGDWLVTDIEGAIRRLPAARASVIAERFTTRAARRL